MNIHIPIHILCKQTLDHLWGRLSYDVINIIQRQVYIYIYKIYGYTNRQFYTYALHKHKPLMDLVRE